MRINEEKIDDFLLDRMSETDRLAFEQELEKDGELANQIKVQQEILDGLAVVGKDQFKARLKRIKEETFAEPVTAPDNTGRNSKWIWWLVAALAIALSAFFFWKLGNNGGEDPNVIYADMFELYEVPVVQRDTDDRQLIQQLSRYYKEGAYQAFIDLHTTREQDLQDHPELLLSLGISYLQTNRAAEAGATMAELEQSNYPAYHDHARWYRILAALQEGNVSKAEELLPRLLEDENADHHDQAKELARRL